MSEKRPDQRPEGARKARGSSFGKASLAVMIPTTMGASMLVAVFIGHYLDTRFATKPWFFLLFLVLGFAAGIRQTMQIIRRIEDSDK